MSRANRTLVESMFRPEMVVEQRRLMGLEETAFLGEAFPSAEHGDFSHRVTVMKHPEHGHMSIETHDFGVPHEGRNYETNVAIKNPKTGRMEYHHGDDHPSTERFGASGHTDAKEAHNYHHTLVARALKDGATLISHTNRRAPRHLPVTR